MKKYKFNIISSVVLFIIMTLAHFSYDILPSFITSLFFPVNESIMEHMKMIYTSYIIFNISLYLLRKPNNIISNFYITCIFNIIIYLIIYIPFFLIFGENMIFTLIWLFITIFISSFISKIIINRKQNNKLERLCIILSIATFLMFIAFTYYPPKYFLFYDYQSKIYGIK